MKKVLKLLLVVFILFLIRLVGSFTINEIIISNYNNGIYNSFLIRSLYIFNFNQPYIAYYNEGNILYKTEMYNDAIERYYLALEKRPPKKRVCDIKINLALAKIKTIDTLNTNTAYLQLEEIQNILQDDWCQSNSQETRYLEEGIEKLQEQLNNGDDSSSSDNNQDGDDQDDQKNKDIEDQLKDIQKEANANRHDDMNQIDNWQSPLKPGYNGKKW